MSWSYLQGLHTCSLKTEKLCLEGFGVFIGSCKYQLAKAGYYGQHATVVPAKGFKHNPVAHAVSKDVDRGCCLQKGQQRSGQ
jgi:hypothetical protein